MKTVGTMVCALLLVALPAGAAERKLLTLESSPQNSIELQVFDVPGAQRADPVAAFSKWKLKPGDPVRTEKRPPDRVVALYTGTPLATNLLCRVVLRYYPSATGWTPHFRLDEELAVAQVNGGWQPVAGVADLVRYGGTLPNADGFFSTIEFGLSAGSLAIIAWQAR